MTWLLTGLIISFCTIIIQPCAIIKNCLHNGTFNNVTCNCDCLASYKGKKKNLT